MRSSERGSSTARCHRVLPPGLLGWVVESAAACRGVAIGVVGVLLHQRTRVTGQPDRAVQRIGQEIGPAAGVRTREALIHCQPAQNRSRRAAVRLLDRIQAIVEVACRRAVEVRVDATTQRVVA